MANKKKYLLLSVTILVLGVAGLGYYLYNKPAVDIQSASGQKVSATELYSTFIKDSALAKKKFTNKILEVSGKVTLISDNQQHQRVVMLSTGLEGASINCTLEGEAANVRKGAMLKIKGICNGLGEGEPELGIPGDVYLVRCYIVQ